MTNLFKVVIFTAPIAALIFYYVVVKQHQHEATSIREELEFEQQWNEMQAEFTSDPKLKAKYMERARRADQKLAEIQRKEEEKQRKADEFEKEFEQALKEADKQFKEPLAPEKPTRR
ncbi:MAG: hypothetical protein QXS68_06650 [Candidatus Methanomethylicaceae archaeon]